MMVSRTIVNVECGGLQHSVGAGRLMLEGESRDARSNRTLLREGGTMELITMAWKCIQSITCRICKVQCIVSHLLAVLNQRRCCRYLLVVSQQDHFKAQMASHLTHHKSHSGLIFHANN